MKKIIFLSMAILAFLFTSCEYDNYDAPSLKLYGKLTYNGYNFLYDGTQRGLLRVYQTGFGKTDGGTAIAVNDKGEFNSLLFADENYKMTPDNRKYPFEFKDFKSRAVGYDSLMISLKKDMELNLEVTPYYTVNNFTVSQEGTNIAMRFKVVKVSGTQNPAPAVIKARAYVSTSVIVNSGTICNVAKDVNITDQGDVEILIPVSSYKNSYVNNFRTYAFCRVSIELENTPDYYLFSDIKKIEGLPG